MSLLQEYVAKNHKKSTLYSRAMMLCQRDFNARIDLERCIERFQYVISIFLYRIYKSNIIFFYTDIFIYCIYSFTYLLMRTE